MIKLFTTIFSFMTTNSGSSFLSMGLGFKFVIQILANIGLRIWNFLQSAIWTIIKWILGVVEAFEYIINQFLGIGYTVNDYYAFAKNTEFFNSLVKTFRAICGVGVVLLILFTIIAIIKQEYQNAVSGMTPEGNNKTPIIINLLKKLVAMIALPIMMIFVVTGVNSILTSFSRALKGEINMTVAAQVLAASSYDANKYRKYANENKRVPIVIQAYDADSYGSDQSEQLAYKIKSADVQTKLLNTATMMTEGSYLSFKDSLIYKNNKLANSAQFGDYYDSFVCTAEQYQVMADFVDYAEKTGLTYYIKTVDDENVEWKYVDSSIYDSNNNTLTINYRDASDINNNNNKNDSYTIQYAMSYTMSSPISDALDSILAMLGVGEYSDNLYKVMERDENSTNIVKWANDKVLIKLSENFTLANQSTWKEADQIIMYEYYRFPANNTFGGVTLETLMTTGVELDAKQIVYRDYYPEADAYSPEKVVNVVDINNNYYEIEQSSSLRDNYGNKYYVLKTVIGDKDENGNPIENVFLNRDYKTIEKKIEINPDTGAALKNTDGSVKYQMATLKFSDDFNINFPSEWTYSDQIIMYEYYRDLTSSNMFYTNSLEDFKTGVQVPVYTITNFSYNINDDNYVLESSSNFALINGTYYVVDAEFNLYDTYKYYDPNVTGSVLKDFLTGTSTSSTVFYNYEVKIADETNRFGVTTTVDCDADSLFYDDILELCQYTYPLGHPLEGQWFAFKEAEIDTSMTEEEKEKILNAQEYTLKFSNNFDYRNTNTWTYKDYFIFYLYSKYPSIAGPGGLDTLKYTGITGQLGQTGIEETDNPYDTKLVFKIDVEQIPDPDTGGFYFTYEEIYLDYEKVMKISEELMFQKLSIEETLFNNHIDTLSDNLFYTIDSFENSQITAGSVKSKEFAHSENFSEFDIQHWTVEDLILYLMSSKGIIDETSTIVSKGYEAQVYQILDENDEVIDTLYRFGDTWNIDTADQTLFLSEQSILNSKSFSGAQITANIDAWLASNATEFVARKLGVVLGGLITDNSGIVGNMYADYSNNIYTMNALIQKITQENLLNAVTKTDEIEIYQDIIPTTYERNDPSAFDANDLSTWTQLDFIIYALTGDIYDGYTSNVLIHDGKKYFIIGDKAVQLDGDYTTSIENESKIISQNYEFSGTTFTELKEVSTFDSLVVNGTDLQNKNLIHYLNETFSYSSQVSRVGTDGIDDKTKLTVFDVILARYTDSLDDGNYKLFTDGDEIYLMLKNKTEAAAEQGIYVKLSQNLSDEISFDKKISMKLVTEKKAFAKTGTISLFNRADTFVENTTIANGEAVVSALESVVFNITNKSEKQDFDVFKSTDNNSYIIADGNYINITGVSDAEIVVEDKNAELSINSNILRSYLFENYYKSYIQSKVSGFLVGAEYNYSIEVKTDFDKDDVSTWTPIAIILEELGFNPSLIVYGTVMVKENAFTGEHENYLYISQNNAALEGRLEEYYIYLDDICDIIPPNTDENTADTAILKSKRRVVYENILRLLQINITNVGGEPVAEIDVDQYLTFNTWLSSKFQIDSLASKSGLTEEITCEFDQTDPSTWDWFDLLYYYYNGKVRTSSNENFEMYYFSTTSTYIKIPYGSNYVFMKNKTLSNFSDTESTSVSAFDNQSEMEPLSIIYYTLTNEKNAVTLLKYKFGTDASDYFYYIENKYTGAYQAVYGLNESDDVGYDSSDANAYTYITKDISDFVNWTVLDWIFAYLRGVTNSAKVSVSTMKLKNGANPEVQYMVFDNKYIRLDGFAGFGSIATLDSTNKVLTSNKLLTNFVDNDADDNSNIVHLYDSSASAPDEIESSMVSIESAEYEKVYFSKNFDASDFTTWKLSDFIIYYLFQNGSFNDLIYNTGSDTEDNSIKNFQELVNQGYAPAYVCYLLSSDDTGNIKTKKVYSFSTNSNKESNNYYVNYDLFKHYYSRVLIGKVFESTGNSLKITIRDKFNIENNVTLNWRDIKPNKFYIERLNDLTAKDFEYKNYYYWKAEYDWLENTTIYDVPAELITLIESGNAKYKYSINLKLSTAFRTSDPNNPHFMMANNEHEIQKWNLLDFIIMNEYAKNTKSNVFYGVNIEELALTDNHFVLFTNDEESIHVLAINGTYYNLTDYITGTDNEKVVSHKYLIPKDDTKDGVENITLQDGSVVKGYPMDKFVTKGNTSEYSFKLLREVIDFVAVKDGSSDIYEFPADKKVFSFVTPVAKQFLTETFSNNVTFIRTLNSNVNAAFYVDTSQYKNFTISPIVREVNWPQKLMNDMQVLYPDLNWSTLIATDGWLDTLGEFHSAYTSGEFITSGNSSNTTAAGLVLSEFFVSIAKESEMGFAKYEYTSIFDEEVIKALMLAMLGEYEYNALKMQAEIFVEMFNIAFAPILEDIANARGINIVDGTVDNFTMSVYKSYLATVLLSSDMGEYFYKVATRVYAQYTIYESLAAASGDYARYLKYINGGKDESGEEVKSFIYSSFYDLLVYENTVLGAVSPTFTFNYARAYKFFDSETTKTDAALRNELLNKANYQILFDRLYEYYEKTYNRGGRVKDTEVIYCFMFDTYFSIKQELKSRGETKLPEYLKIYNSYLKGEIKRWGMIEGVNVEAGSSKIKDYKKYQAQLAILKFASYGAIAPVVAIDNVSYDFSNNEEATNAFEAFEQAVNNTSVSSPLSLLQKTMATAPQFSEDLVFIIKNIKNLLSWFSDSEKGDNEAWNNITNFSSKITGLVNELAAVCELPLGSVTQNGASKIGTFTDEYYASSLKKIRLFEQTIKSYVDTQKMLDVIIKTSITYTLGQYGQNYVADGYIFNLGNRQYTVGVSFSSSRLAEYVYGGAFLENFGVPAQFTDEEFEGFISISKSQDGATGMVKTKLGMWNELRKFATEIANYTGKLYYLTNMNDLSDNIGDDIKLTSNLRLSNDELTTLEKLILEYLIDSDISADTLVRLIMGDTTSTLGANGLGLDENSDIYKLANWLETRNIVIDDSGKRGTLKQYLNLVYGSAYNSHGYYFANDNTPSERIHLIFKKVISYLLVSEESEESSSEKAINLENLTFKEFKVLLINGLVNYKENPTETDKENSGRYLALFDLISTQFNYQITIVGSGTIKTRTISEENLKLDVSVANYAETKYFDGLNQYSIVVDFSEDKATKDMIINLAGAENQPVENLVNLEYKELYDMKGNYDEANGDTFVVCTYDEISGKFIPVLATNIKASFDSESPEQIDFNEYFDKYDIKVYTSYYDTAHHYPIVAKGIIDATGKPTAIRMVDYQIEYYRSNITATSKVDDTALSRTSVEAVTDTVGYTNYTSTTFQNNGTTQKKDKAMFVADSNLSDVVHSDMSVFYLQTKDVYQIEANDDLGGMNVLDSFSLYYKLDTMSYLIMYLSLATLIPLLFKSCFQVMRRVLDLGALILIGPWAIAASAIENPGSGSGSYKMWQNNVAKTLLAAFGFVIGFNIYYIFVTLVTNMTFVSELTVLKIQNIGGFGFITQARMNSIVSIAFVLVATGSIESSANMLVSIVTGGRVSNAFQAGTGDAFKEVKERIHEAVEMGKKAKSIISGEMLTQLPSAAIETAKSMIPGSAIVGRGIDFAKEKRTNKKAKDMQKQAEAHGVDPKIAKRAAENYKRLVNEQRQARRSKQLETANKFTSTIGMGDLFKDPPKIFGKTEKESKKSKKDKKKKKKSKK